MNFGRAFSYMFEDSDWLKKVGIAAAVVLIPVIGLIILAGWGLEITRRVIVNDPQPLPGWEDFGSYVSKGFQVFVVALAYLLPFILLIICGQALMLVPALAIDDPDLASGLAVAVMSCSYCIAILLGLAGSLLLPARLATWRLPASWAQLSDSMKFLGCCGPPSAPYILTVLLVALVSSLLSPLGSALCGIGLLITTAYTSAVSSHLYGQAYKIARATMA